MSFIILYNCYNFDLNQFLNKRKEYRIDITELYLKTFIKIFEINLKFSLVFSEIYNIIRIFIICKMLEAFSKKNICIYTYILLISSVNSF